MKSSKAGTFRRAVALLTMTPLFLGALAMAPASAGDPVPPPPVKKCGTFSFLNLTADIVVENATIRLFDDKGNLLSAQVAASVLINANLVVCVEADVAAEVGVFLGGVLDSNGDGKKDTIDVITVVGALANLDAHVKISAHISGQIAIWAQVSVQARVNAYLTVGAGEKKWSHCKGKDGIDTK